MTLQLQNSLYLQREYSDIHLSYITRFCFPPSRSIFALSLPRTRRVIKTEIFFQDTRVHWLVQTFSRSAYLHEARSWSWPRKWDVIGRIDEWLIKSVESTSSCLNLRGGNPRIYNTAYVPVFNWFCSSTQDIQGKHECIKNPSSIPAVMAVSILLLSA